MAKPKLTKLEIKRRIEKINDARIDAIQALAAEVREQYVVPACKKTNMSYTAGNGETLFFSDQTSIYYSFDVKGEKLKPLLPVMGILEIETGNNDVIGYYVADVEVK